MSTATNYENVKDASIVPLAIPLLAGSAAFSYVMGNSERHGYVDLIHVVMPILIVGIASWVIFYFACKTENEIWQLTQNIVERVSGLILGAMAVEMIATGLRSLFPILAPG